MSAGSNQFGKLFQWTSFGESHGPAMGVVIDGCPSGVKFDPELLLQKLAARKPGQSGATDRQESDQPEILSGVFEGKTLGTPIAVLVRNQDQRSQDYSKIQQQPRIGHADDMWSGKFKNWDYRGGGRASARETVNWVIAGAIAEMFVRSEVSNLSVQAQLIQVGGESVSGAMDPQLIQKLEAAKAEGESYGALVEVSMQGVPAFLGEPVFYKAKAEWTKAFMSINACVGVELGEGFQMASQKGTEVHSQSSSPVYGGIRGGITTGEAIGFRLAFKPTSSIADTAKKGRHDPCVALRALPIIEAMAWNVLADLMLARKLN